MARKSKTNSRSEDDQPVRAVQSLVSQRKLPFRGRPADTALTEAIDAALEERFDRPVQP